MTADRSVPTPAWLLAGADADPVVLATSGRKWRGRVVARTLAAATDLIRQALQSAEYAERDGLLQRLEPRVKLVTTTAVLVVVATLGSLPLLACCYVATIGLAAASRLPVAFFVRRVWLFIPIFTGIVVLPATLSVITEGDVVLGLWHWDGREHGFTAQGLYGAGLIVTRVATSISLVVLLTLTTPWARLVAALRAVGVPRIFVLTIGMAYRYLFLLLDAVEDMYVARRARQVGRCDPRSDRRFVLASAGVLFGRSHQLSEEIHQAMMARGFTGEIRVLHQQRPRVIDAAWSAAVVAVSCVVLTVDHWFGG